MITRLVCSLTFLVAGRCGFADEYLVTSATTPAPFLLAETTAEESSGGDLDRVLEASAVALVGDGASWLIAHDKESPLRVVDAATGRQYPSRLASPEFPIDADEGGKWEGMARDTQGRYYLIGSHSGKKDEIRSAHSHLLRFELVGEGDGDQLRIAPGSVRRWQVAEPLKAALESSGIAADALVTRKVEGLAVRELPSAIPGQVARRELVIGMREPDDLVRVFVTDITEEPAHDATLTLAPLFQFEAGSCEGVTRQLTSLEYVPVWEGFLAITTTEDDDNVFHGNTLWFVPDASIGGAIDVRPVEITTFELAMKAEGLAVFPPGTYPDVLRLLITFDNDPKKTAIPSRYQILSVTRLP